MGGDDHLAHENSTGYTSPPEGGFGLALIRVKSLTLMEADTLYVARPLDLTVSPADGSFLVADGFSGQVIRFNPDGQPIGTYGSKGRGPGELMSPSPTVLWNSRLGVGDHGGVLAFFDVASGQFLGQTRLLGIVGPARVLRGELWIGVHNYERGTAFAILANPEDDPQYLVPLPSAYLESARMRMFNLSVVTTFGNHYLVGVSGHPHLWLIDRDGERIDSVAVPSIRRRGESHDFPQALERLDREEALEYASILYGLHELSTGEIAVLHYDHDVIDYRSFILGGRVYLSVLSADLTMACVDGLVYEVEEEIDRVRHAWRADTLFLASQEVHGPEALTRIDAFIVDTNQCDWVPVR